MAMSNDDDLLKYQPDILNYGIDEFTEEHAKAREDILRAKQYYSFEGNSFHAQMEPERLTESQFNRCAVFRVLSEYALPQLTKWNPSGDEDKFQVMMKHYHQRYNEEFEAILMDGVLYDFDEDGTVQDDERVSLNTLKLIN